MHAGSLKRLSEEFEKHPKDYTLGHILITIIYTGEGSVSRAKLQRLLSLGEGSVKSIVKCMIKHNLLYTSARGSRLTVKGMRLLNHIRLHIPELRRISLEYLSVGKVNWVAVLRMIETPDVLKTRDRVIRLGGTGCVLLSFKNGSFKVPYVAENLKAASSRDFEELSKMNLKDDDSILIVGGEKNSLALSTIGTMLFHLLTRQA